MSTTPVALGREPPSGARDGPRRLPDVDEGARALSTTVQVGLDASSTAGEQATGQVVVQGGAGGAAPGPVQASTEGSGTRGVVQVGETGEYGTERRDAVPAVRVLGGAPVAGTLVAAADHAYPFPSASAGPLSGTSFHYRSGVAELGRDTCGARHPLDRETRK